MTSVSKIVQTETQIKLDGVIFGRPTSAGTYITLAGEVPANVELGDIYKWDGSSGVVLQKFDEAPAVVADSNFTYRKSIGAWVSDNLFCFVNSVAIGSVAPGYVAPPGSNSIGPHVQIGGTPPDYVSLNSVFYWDGAKAWPYLSFSQAPNTFYSMDGWRWSKVGNAWRPDVPALAAVLASKPITGLANGLYTQVAGETIHGVALGDIFFWNNTRGSAFVVCRYDAAPSMINIAGDGAMKWAGTWVPYSVTISRALTSTPNSALAAGTYVQVGGILPSGISYGDIFFWLNNVAVKWISYADAPDGVLIDGVNWHKSYGTWVPRVLTVNSITNAQPTDFGLYIQQSGTLPSLTGGGAAAHGDILCHISAGNATRYLAYENAPHTVLIAGVVYAKTGNGIWTNSQQIRDSNRNYFPIHAQFTEGSLGQSSTFVPVGNATVLDLAQKYGEGNLLRLTTNKVADNARFSVPTSYVRMTVSVVPGVDNMFFLKALKQGRWTAIHLWVCNSVGVPVSRIQAQVNTTTSGFRDNCVNLAINQTSACGFNYWEWFSYAIPKDVIAANLLSFNRLNLALCLDVNNSESFAYLDGWAMAANPFSLTHQSSMGLQWGLEAINTSDTPFVWYGDGNERHSIGYILAGQYINRFFVSVPRIDTDIYLSILTIRPAIFPHISLLNQNLSASKYIGQPSSSRKSAHKPEVGAMHAIGALLITAADMRTFAFRNPNSGMWTLRMGLYNPYGGNCDLGSIFTEVA
jgi:hypothetical protein